MRMYTACTAAKYHTFICYTLPFPVLEHRRPCLSLWVGRLKFLPVLAAGCQNQPSQKKLWDFSSRLCSRHNGAVQIRRQWWIKPSKLLIHRLGVCADEVSVDAKGLFVHDALCYGKLLYAYGVKYMWDINLCFSFSSIFRELCVRKVFCMWKSAKTPLSHETHIISIMWHGTWF